MNFPYGSISRLADLFTREAINLPRQADVNDSFGEFCGVLTISQHVTVNSVGLDLVVSSTAGLLPAQFPAQQITLLTPGGHSQRNAGQPHFSTSKTVPAMCRVPSPTLK